jgi:hypothetical protein
MYWKAADEITRLREENERLKAELDQWKSISPTEQDAIDLAEQVIELTQELTSLKAELSAGEAFYKVTVKQRDSAWEELASLKAQSAEPFRYYWSAFGSGNGFSRTIEEAERYSPETIIPLYTHPAPRDEQVETLRRDAERYRWLRQYRTRLAPDLIPPYCSLKKLDDAIDDARG